MNMETETNAKTMIEAVLTEISSDRRTAHAALKAIEKEASTQIDAINERDATVVKALADAQADLRAHMRFEKRMPKQAFDEKRRIIDVALAEAQANHTAASKKARDELAPIQERAEAAQKRIAELAREWQAHLRLAKAADVDVARYWTPENPEPVA